MNRNGIIVQNNIHSGKFIARSWQMHPFDNINHNVNILTHPVPSMQASFFPSSCPRRSVGPGHGCCPGRSFSSGFSACTRQCLVRLADPPPSVAALRAASASQTPEQQFQNNAGKCISESVAGVGGGASGCAPSTRCLFQDGNGDVRVRVLKW